MSPPPVNTSQAFVLALGDALRPLADAVAIQVAASRLLGEHLGANRVAYFEVRGSDYYIERDYANGVSSFNGRYPITSFGTALLAQYRSGRTAVSNDVAGDASLSKEEHAAYAAVEVGAYIGVPLIKGGEFVVGMGVHARGPRDWTATEIELVQETAERTWAAVQRARAEAELARSARHFQAIFDSIDQGLCTIEVLFDENRRPVDYRFLEMNAAFERQTGLVGAVGKRMRELNAGLEQFWFDIYGRIALTGEAQRFEHAAEALGRFYEVYAFRIGTPLECKVAVLFNDIAERKRRERNLAFVAEISLELAQLKSIDETMVALGERLCRYLGLSACSFVDIDDEAHRAHVGHEWHGPGLPDVKGTYDLTAYLAADLQGRLRAGEAIVVQDTGEDPLVNARNLGALGISSLLCTPVIKDGQWRFLFSAHHSEARQWQPDEIELVRELTDRIWTRLAQARADEALKVSEARHRALFNQMLGGVAETDLHGRFVSVNQRYCDILGYSREELLGMHMQDVLHPEDAAINLLRRERLVQHGEPFQIEKRYLRKDGSVIWVHNSVSMLSDGQGHPRGLISVSLDITERKWQEDRLRRGSELLDFIVHHSPSGFFIVGADFRISHMNAESQARAFRLVNPAIGYRLDEAMRVLWPEPLATEIIEIFQRTLDTGEPYVSDGLVARRADSGVMETYEWQVQRITMPDGAFAVVCFYYDTTRQSEVERDLREADQRKDEFLATLAHELRNPLAPIRNSLQLLRRQNAGDASDHRVHDMLERQVTHMVRMVDDLMEVSRITRGKFELRREAVDLAEVMRQTLETCQPIIEAAGHAFSVTWPSQVLTVHADTVRLVQVLTNLLDNAAKYTPGHGRIWLSAQRDGENAVISVMDNGAGIPASVLPKVFDLFAQAEQTYRRAQGGLGIGLTLVRNIVQMHGGSVEARSDGPGHGSEFIVRLPLLAARAHAPTASPPAVSAPAPAPSAHRILVVDDNRDSADSLGMILQCMGADTQAVYDGPAALQTLGSYRPSVMILDIGMPGMDGYEVAQRVRAMPEGEGVTLIALSGWGQHDDLSRSHEAGFDRHLVKPVDTGVLEQLLSTLPRPSS